jgi:hypothetical protein
MPPHSKGGSRLGAPRRAGARGVVRAPDSQVSSKIIAFCTLMRFATQSCSISWPIALLPSDGYSRSRVDAPASVAGIGRLHEATGRPVLTAAAAGQSALEMPKLGHGVFTSALIDALHHGDRNGNGLIEVSELAAHVQDMVPKLVAGGEGRSAIELRGTGGGGQSARFGTTGGDFALVKQLQ